MLAVGLTKFFAFVQFGQNIISEECMTPKKFVKEYSGAPWEMEKIASVACKVKGDLGKKAESYLEALREFEDALKEVGYEFG